MFLTFNTAYRQWDTAIIVEELPEIGKPFHMGLIDAREVKALEPIPYTYPQTNQENYQYSVWRIIYRPDNLIEDDEGYVAIHEPEAEVI